MSAPDKDFAPIQDDYAFFMTHSNEQERDTAAFVDVLREFSTVGRCVRVLDFGCGPGGFTERLIQAMNWGGGRCELSVVEPVDDYRGQAVERLKGLVGGTIEARAGVPDGGFGPFDVIVSNHVLYYVPDLDTTLGRLCGLLAPGGVFATALAGNDNDLIQMWHKGFGLAGRSMPYNVADDVTAALTRLGISYESKTVPYELVFSDSRENRLKILRFLFAQHLTGLPIDGMLGLFDPFVEGGQVVIRTVDVHVAVRA